ALGTPTVSVLEMADMYLTFATRGLHVSPSVVLKVTDSSGHLLEERTPPRTRALEPAQADVVNFVLQQVVKDGTGTHANPGVPVAGKTGTTENYGDACFCGYTPGLATAVW